MTAPRFPQLGDPVIYQTDERGGKRYCLPAIITGTHDSHPDRDSVGQLAMHATQHILSSNPVPIPNTTHLGAVHLFIMSPGPTMFYTEDSVPQDESEHPAPRTWHYPR